MKIQDRKDYDKSPVVRVLLRWNRHWLEANGAGRICRLDQAPYVGHHAWTPSPKKYQCRFAVRWSSYMVVFGGGNGSRHSDVGARGKKRENWRNWEDEYDGSVGIIAAVEKVPLHFLLKNVRTNMPSFEPSIISALFWQLHRRIKRGNYRYFLRVSWSSGNQANKREGLRVPRK